MATCKGWNFSDDVWLNDKKIKVGGNPESGLYFTGQMLKIDESGQSKVVWATPVKRGVIKEIIVYEKNPLDCIEVGTIIVSKSGTRREVIRILGLDWIAECRAVSTDGTISIDSIDLTKSQLSFIKEIILPVKTGDIVSY